MHKFERYFPFLNYKNNHYFDNAATNIKLGSVSDAEKEFLEKINANPHSRDFDNAFIATSAIEQCRTSVAQFINAEKSEEIIFTSGATYSLNQVAFGLAPLYNEENKKNVVITELEHASNLLPWMVLQHRGLIEVRYAPLNTDGTIDATKLSSVIDSNTVVFSFASISNTIGASNDIKELVKMTRSLKKDVLICVDAAQSVAHEKIDVQALDIDFVVFSAHKLFGPFGVGILWGRSKILNIIEPLTYGGGSNETITKKAYVLANSPAKFEAGTQNLSGIYAFQKVFDFLNNELPIKNIHEMELDLKKYIITKIKNVKNKEIIFYNSNNSGMILLFNVKNIPAQDMADYLYTSNKIAVRAGTHCAKLLNNFIGCTTSVRASFSFLNTKEEIDLLFNALEVSTKEWTKTII